MQRNLLTGDAWPADEIDDNPDRYIEFGIQPNAGNDLKINNISHSACVEPVATVCVPTSTTLPTTFETRTTIFEDEEDDWPTTL